MSRSVYLTRDEEHGLRELARANGLAENLILRIGLQRLLGRQTVELTAPVPRVGVLPPGSPPPRAG